MAKFFLVLLLAVVSLTLVQEPVFAQAASGGFEKLKSLVGEWQGTTPNGKTHVSYKLISNGTALMETMGMENEQMVTIYHPDGNSLMLTHYCADNNQPRMRANVLNDPKSIQFSYVDATNLKSPDAGHMHRLIVTFQDENHFSQQWTWIEKGEEKTYAFQYERME